MLRAVMSSGVAWDDPSEDMLYELLVSWAYELPGWQHRAEWSHVTV